MGGRIRRTRPLAEWSLGASVLASDRKREWSTLVGLDAEVRFGRFELLTEALYQSGEIPERDIAGVYVQGRYTLVKGLFLLARYEFCDRLGRNYDPVHPDRQDALDLTRVAQIDLKQRRFWRDGSVVVPIDRSAGSDARESFSQAVFRTSAETQRPYWNRQDFLGVLPAITLASSEAVLRYVASEPRAIGYVPIRLVDARVRIAVRYEGERESIERSHPETATEQSVEPDRATGESD